MSNTFSPKGFYAGATYIGFLPGNKRMVFPTEQEYMDFIRDYIEECA